MQVGVWIGLQRQCGDRRAKPNLKDFQVRYWMNPNQLYWSGVYPDRYKLSTARSICLRNCPTTIPAGNGNASSQLSWVCDYPEGTYSSLSMRDWEQRNYDYFDLLTPDQIASSRNLTGPCYPVLFESVNCTKNSHLSKTVSEENRVQGVVAQRFLSMVTDFSVLLSRVTAFSYSFFLF